MEDRVKKILCVLMVLGVAPCFFVEAMQRQAMRVQESPTVSGVSRTSSISGPRLMKFSGTLNDGNGAPLTGMAGITFSLYANEQGGAPLWMENQNVQLDEQGNYAVLLGSTGSGIPVELFASGEPRWLGVQSQSQDAQSRILLNGRAPLPEDWTDHTVVFSKPADPQKAFQLSQDPRYAKQWNGRNRAGSTNPNVANPAAADAGKGGGKKNPPPPGTPQGDWNLSLGPTGSSRVAPNMFPAKYNFDINQAPSCTQDFVVFAENATGATAVNASQTGTFSLSNGTGGVTVNGTVLTASAGTAAARGGTFTANVRNSGSVTITNGGNTLTLTPNPTSRTIAGTFSGAVSGSTTTATLTVGLNTLNLTDGRATGFGTFAAPLCFNNGEGVTINGTSLTTNAVAAAGSITITTNPSAGNNVTINGPNAPTAQTYTFRTSVGTTANEVLIGGSNAASAANLRAAINLDSTQCGSGPPCFGSLTAANANVTAPSVSTNAVSLTAKCAGTAYNVAISDSTSNITETGMSGGTNGSTSGANFAISTTASTDATNLTTAINANAGTGVIATSSGGIVTLAASTPGSAGNSMSLTQTFTSGFGWSGGTLGGGSDTNGCTSATVGNFVNSSTVGTAAANLSDAINSCNGSFPAVGATSTATAGVTTITATTPGTDIALSGAEALGNFSWGTPATGSNGTNTCTSATTGTFAISSTTGTEATNLRDAIIACPVAAGVTATASGSTTTVTARTNGTAGNSIGLGNTLAGFGWAGTLLTGGADGSTSGTSFATSADITTEAANLASAINTNVAAVTATSSGAVVTVTANTAGSAGNSIGTTATVTGFSWGSTTLQGGLNAQPSIVAVNQLYSGASTTASDTGTFTANSLVGGETVTVTNGANSVGVTASTPTKASQTGTFSGNVGSGTGSATLGTLVLTPNPTAGTIVGTFQNTAPGNSGNVKITVGSNTLTLTGGNGSANSCPTNSTAGTFNNNRGNANQEAGDLAAAINACNSSFSAVGATAIQSGSAVTVTATAKGSANTPSATTTISSSLFAWASPSAGTDGTNTCGSTTAGTFAISSNTDTEASNLAAAINLCPAGVLVTATATGSTVTVTAKLAGSSGNIASTKTLTGFSWGGTTLTGGSDGSNTGLNFSFWSGSTAVSTTILATNLAAAIQRNGGAPIGVGSTSSTSIVTVTATTAGSAGNSITMQENLPGFSWANPTLFGGTEIGICPGPAVTYSYLIKTGAGGPITTSPVLSIDGQKLAFVESVSGGSVLHILRPNTAATNGTGTEGTVITPVVPTTVISSTSGSAATDWANCLATADSCMFNLVYTNTTNAQSSPFYNYATDELYVGDDGGKLWKATGVFNGTPALAGGGWAAGILVNLAHKLTSPVLEFTSSHVIVGDDSGRLSYVRDTGSPTGACGTGSVPCLGTPSITAFTANTLVDPVIIDGSTGKIFAFGGGGTSLVNAKVVQTDTTFSSTVAAAVGQSSTVPIHSGAFSDGYFTGADPSAGFLYVCGKNSSTDSPTLYRIGFSSLGVMNSTKDTSSLPLSADTAQCSPLTEIKNTNQGGGTDWLFLGMPGTCSAFGGSTGGCVMSFNITSSFPTTAAATRASTAGTSGIVVDNVSTDGHASSLYYSTLGAASCTGGSAGGCAVQTTQSGLQ